MLYPRKYIKDLKPVYHGGPHYEELKEHGFTASEVLDFSVNCNPFGCTPEAAWTAAAARFDIYPDSHCGALREAIAQFLSLSKENIICGAGSMEIIRLAALAYLDEGDKVCVPSPSFGEYALAAQVFGARVVDFAADKDTLEFDINKLSAFIKGQRPKMVFLANPNNPTGQYHSRADIMTLAAACEDTLLVLDEAYIAFTEQAWDSTFLAQYPNVLVLRSMTKDYALAGLRLGYAFAHPDIISNLQKVQAPWSVSAPAQAAGVVCIKDVAFLRDSTKKVAQGKAYLVENLSKLGYKVRPSATNFFLVEVGNGAAFREDLLKEGIVVRSCASFGLPHMVRISPRIPAENERLISVLQSLKTNEH